MLRKPFWRIFAIVGCVLLTTACQKNTTPSQEVLSEQKRNALMTKVRTDTIFKQWQENQKKGFELMKAAVKTGKIDVAKMKAYQPNGKEADYITALKEAGMVNAEEFNAINKKGMELLRQLWKKYPDLKKLSPDDFVELGKKEKVTTQKPQL
ncbi:MAG: hypothetical protein WCF67_22070 [Chitinophagaceae bacterium]